METESDVKCRLCENCKKAFSTEVDFEVHLCFHTKKCPSLCSSGDELCKSFHCCLCGKEFDCRIVLDNHKNTHTGEKPYSCSYCHFRSTTSNYLKVHIVRNHTKEFKHNCSFCSKGFVHKSELQRHIQSSHPSEDTDKSIVVKKEKEEVEENQKQPDQMHCCTYCTYVTKIKNNFIRHLWTHSSYRPYQCEICKKGFTQKAKLRDHLRTHTGERPFVCNTCNWGYTTKTALRTHERLLHPEEYLRDPSKHKEGKRRGRPPRNCKSYQVKPAHQCIVCKKTFSTKVKLLFHIRVHTDDCPFECDACQKRYATQKSLSRHKRLHSEERKEVMHRCPLCPFSASREFSFRMHLQTHSGKGGDKCHLCNRVVNNMEKHLEKCKGRKSLQCKHCSKLFTQKELMKHRGVCKEKHPFTCSTCGRGFYTLSYLKFHETMHSTSQKQKTPAVKKELQNSTHLLITRSTPKQTLVVQKHSTANFQPVPVQNQLIILQPAIILNGS